MQVQLVVSASEPKEAAADNVSMCEGSFKGSFMGSFKGSCEGPFKGSFKGSFMSSSRK